LVASEHQTLMLLANKPKDKAFLMYLFYHCAAGNAHKTET